MNINFNKIYEIYGEDVIELIKENVSEITKNLGYMIKLGFNDVEDIFERYSVIFICGNNEFVEKINNLINNLGENYVEIIENDLGILEELA